MAALGFLFADEIAPTEVIAILATALGAPISAIGFYDIENMPDSPIIVEVIAREPDFRTDVSVYGPDDRLKTLNDLALATLVNRTTGKTVLCSAPDHGEPFWILINSKGQQSLVKANIDGTKIHLQET